LPRLHPDKQILLCCGNRCNIYDELEQLPVAADRSAVSGEKDAAAGHGGNGLVLHAGLRYDDGSSRAGDDSDCADLLPDAEAVCGRYDRFRERINIIGGLWNEGDTKQPGVAGKSGSVRCEQRKGALLAPVLRDRRGYAHRRSDAAETEPERVMEIHLFSMSG